MPFFSKLLAIVKLSVRTVTICTHYVVISTALPVEQGALMWGIMNTRESFIAAYCYHPIIFLHFMMIIVLIFYILTDAFSRLEGILECLPKKDKRSLLATLQTYWLLKRRSRNGLPLLRRLQVAVAPAVATKV